jgi:hypothetical protein
MKPKALQYLTRAESSRTLVISLIAPAATGRAPYEWAIVIAFQAVVDSVQALLYERKGVEHGNHHRARRGAFEREPEADVQSAQGLTALDHCVHLEDKAHDARYKLGFTAHRIDVDGALYEDLEAIRTVVGAALGWVPPP